MAMPELSSMLAIVLFLLFMTTINQPSSARTLGVPSSGHRHHRHAHSSHSSTPTITFLMQDVLNGTRRLSRPTTSKVNDQLPFQKPLGLFPPSGGIPLAQPNPTRPATGFSTQTLDLSSIGLSFPARATLQELEFGTVIVIDEDIFDDSVIDSGLLILGKAQGVYVVSSEDGRSHMMAMTMLFTNDKFKDSLRLFGVKMTDISESHIAVIGGTGNYNNANGYATIKSVNYQSDGVNNKLLLFNVYLSI